MPPDFPTPPNSDILTIAARPVPTCGCSRQAINRFRRDGKLPVIAFGPRKVRFRRADLDAFYRRPRRLRAERMMDEEVAYTPPPINAAAAARLYKRAVTLALPFVADVRGQNRFAAVHVLADQLRALSASERQDRIAAGIVSGKMLPCEQIAPSYGAAARNDYRTANGDPPKHKR